jgi:hypothetical protein
MLETTPERAIAWYACRPAAEGRLSTPSRKCPERYPRRERIQLD